MLLFTEIASFAQHRLWMDDKVRFKESIAGRMSVFNEMLIYNLTSTTSLHVDRLRQALALIITKHSILHTALIYDQDTLIQKILPVSSDHYDLKVTRVTSDDQLKQILLDEETNRSLFDLERGQVFRCHVLCRSSHSGDHDNLKQNDIIIFNFHHIAIDGSSIQVFIDDLRQALISRQLPHDNEERITYLDYAHYERLEDWSNARQYWNKALTSLNISIDQLNHPARTGRGYTKIFDLDHTVVVALNRFISQSTLTLFQAGLAAFFVFLFKMSNSEQLDLCTGVVVANRSHYQLQNMIGFFVNTIPFSLKIDPYESFAELCHKIKQHWLDILPYSHLPYQEIVKNNQSLRSSLIRTLFLIETRTAISDQNIEVDQENTFKIIERRLLTGNTAKFDMICILYENRQNETISVSLNASLDIYDESTISIMASRLKNIFDQLFSVSFIYQFSLILPNELVLMHNLNDNFLDYHRIRCIHWEFAHQTQLHPQKVALTLDNASMTYNELLYYAQHLANYLIAKCTVQPGQIVCSLMKRSFEMIIAMISIWMSGGVYTSLSLHSPLARVNAYIQQTNAHLILVHLPTREQSLLGCSLLDVDQVICFTAINQKVPSYVDFVNVTTEDIAYIASPSDSSAMLKAVS